MAAAVLEMVLNFSPGAGAGEALARADNIGATLTHTTGFLGIWGNFLIARYLGGGPPTC